MKNHYVIQPELAWKHRRVTIRAKQQLNFAKKRGHVITVGLLRTVGR